MLKIGTLGAAKITPAALVKPARRVPGAEVVAVAARDRARASRFAERHGISTVHPSYEALIADPNVDAVYNPLPNGLHGHWTVAALEAGKHVLCEKPFTANAAEAAAVAAAGARSGRVLMEAFHWRYHPLATRVLDVLGSGVLGPLRSLEAWVCFPLLLPGDIRYRLDLAGGAMMDAGCYAVNMLRALAGSEPAVVSARAKLQSPGVDRAMSAQLLFPGGVDARFTCSMRSRHVLRIQLRAVGEDGRLDVINPFANGWNRLTIRASGVRTAERVKGDTTYTYQLRAFLAAVENGVPPLTGPAQAVANMAVIDAVYGAAGLEVRQPTPA